MFVLNLEYFGNKKNQDFLIKVIKIIILGFVSFSLLASAIPFYLGFDDVSFGNASINLSKGNASITNELLQEMGLKMFVPTSHVITSDKKSAVPVFTVGIYSIGALSFILIGFVLVELWSKLSSNQPERNKKLKSLPHLLLAYGS